jgi:hypothetical protein
MAGRPVNARAAFTAPITASVPELQKRICSNASTRSHSSSARASSASVAMAKAVPRLSCACTASVMAGWAWPAMIAV